MEALDKADRLMKDGRPGQAHRILDRLLRENPSFAELLAAAELAVENLTSSDLRRCVELLETYDFLGYVDASIVAVAERLKLKSLVITDRRDFGRVRPRHTRAFELLPVS